MAENDVDLADPELDQELEDEEIEDEDLGLEDEENEDEDLGLTDEDDTDADDDGSEDGDVPVGQETEALSELAAEELELLAEEEEQGVDIPVDEAAELRAIRREELTMNVATKGATKDEFVCSSCFLVLKTSQLANKRKSLCRDCAA